MTEAPQPPASGPPDGGSEHSRTAWIYLAVALGVIVLAVILFLALRPDDSEPAADTTSEAQTTTVQTTTEVTTQQTTTVATTMVQTTTTTPANQPQRVSVRFENGEVVGGLVRADIELDSRVELVVRADVEDEVHLHGYDLSADVAPGQPARISFTADVAGEFEVELEQLGIPLAELTVS
jgi:heme/copper-type cytochrome/quinol oxidase subunit 2